MILLVSQLKWHYGKAMADLFSLWKNLSRFLFNFFSVTLLVRTLFSPFKRLGGGPGTFFENLIAGTLMRVVGAGCRLILIVIGVVSIVLETALWLAFMIVWILLPAVLVLFVVQGFKYFM